MIQSLKEWTLYFWNGIGLSFPRFHHLMRLQIRTACLIVRHNNPKQSPETRPGGRGVVEGGGGVVVGGGCMRHQTSVKDVFGFDLGCAELTNNIKMDFCANAITNTIWGMEKLAQNKHLHFVNIALRQSFNSSNILHKVRVILIDILLSLYPSYFAKDRETLDLEDPRVVFLELYISEVHRFFFLERQVLLLKASPGKSLTRVKRTVFWKNCPKKLPCYTMTDGLRSRVDRPSKKYSQLSLTARKSPSSSLLLDVPLWYSTNIIPTWWTSFTSCARNLTAGYLYVLSPAAIFEHRVLAHHSKKGPV